MTEFYVDTHGMNGLYNVLVRASEDATATLQHTVKHCDLEFNEEGLIMIFAGPHEDAYTAMTTALERLGQLTRDAGTQVNRAQADYARSDGAAMARLDRGYPGAKNAAVLHGTLAQGRTDLQAPHAAFADVAQPTAHLVNPEYFSAVEKFELNPLADLISPAAWLRQASVWLFGWDPFEGWGKAFSGDWAAYEHCAATWGAVGNAAHDIGRNLGAVAPDVASVWRGKAAEAEQEFQLALGAAAMYLKPACHEYSTLYLQAADATKQLFNVVTGLITKLIDTLIIINAASAVGTATIETGIGPLIGYGVAAYYIWQAYDLYNEISTFFGNTEAVLRTIAGTIMAVRASLDVGGLPEMKPYHHPAGY